MNPITLVVQTSEDKKFVVIGADTIASDVKESRSYFLEPVQAVEIANAILHSAEDCGVQVHVQTAPRVSDLQRLALIARVGHIIRTMDKSKTSKVALQIVDSILVEVL